MRTLWQDVRYGARMLWKAPGFTLVAVGALALGIGANSTIFSAVNGFLLRSLPVAEPERVVIPFELDRQRNPAGNYSYPDYVDYRDQNEVFSGLLCQRLVSVALGHGPAGGDRNDLVWGEMVSGNYFDVLGVEAALGRTFLPEEGRTPGTHPVVVIGHSLWRRHFDADPSIVGRDILLNGRPFTVVGVAPEKFLGTKYALSMDYWVPIMMQEQIMPGGARLDERGDHWLGVMGRLKPGVTIEQAEANLTAIARRLEQAHPARGADVTVAVLPEREGRFGYHSDVANAFTLGAGLALVVVGIVLLIACANVANLLLARAAARRKEIGLRLALGARRARIVRQLLTESMLLALLGGAAGLLIAFWTGDLMWTFVPALPYNFSLDFTPDARVLGWTLGLSLLTGVVFGLVPALQASRPDLVPALKGDALAGDRVSPRRLSLRNALVVAQVAMSLVVLVCGGLFVKSLRHAQQIDPGFRTERVLTMTVDPGLLGYTREEGLRFYAEVVRRIEALPGVLSVSTANLLPLGDSSNSTGPILAEGEAPPPPGAGLDTNYSVVGPRHFETLGIVLEQGREFTGRDRPDAPAVVVVNETMARRLWPGESALGKRLRIGTDPSAPLREVVGVARDGKYRTLGEAPRTYLYLPQTQSYRSQMTLLIHTAGAPRAVEQSARRAVQAIDARLPVFGVKTMEEHMSYALWGPRMGATLASVCGLVGLLLAAMGVFGVMSYAVAQRTREIGIRMALGAQSGDVLRLIARQGLVLALVGVALGLAGALAATRILSSLLYGVGAHDLTIFVGVPVLIVATALLATYVPARRATRVEPVVALRHE